MAEQEPRPVVIVNPDHAIHVFPDVEDARRFHERNGGELHEGRVQALACGSIPIGGVCAAYVVKPYDTEPSAA